MALEVPQAHSQCLGRLSPRQQHAWDKPLVRGSGHFATACFWGVRPSIDKEDNGAKLAPNVTRARSGANRFVSALVKSQKGSGRRIPSGCPRRADARVYEDACGTSVDWTQGRYGDRSPSTLRLARRHGRRDLERFEVPPAVRSTSSLRAWRAPRSPDAGGAPGSGAARSPASGATRRGRRLPRAWPGCQASTHAGVDR